jgi:hypothetical protein
VGELPFAADRCPCVEKLRTCYQLLLAIRDSAFQLVSTLGSVVISAGGVSARPHSDCCLDGCICRQWVWWYSCCARSQLRWCRSLMRKRQHTPRRLSSLRRLRPTCGAGVGGRSRHWVMRSSQRCWMRRPRRWTRVRGSRRWWRRSAGCVEPVGSGGTPAGSALS